MNYHYLILFVAVIIFFSPEIRSQDIIGKIYYNKAELSDTSRVDDANPDNYDDNGQLASALTLEIPQGSKLVNVTANNGVVRYEIENDTFTVYVSESERLVTMEFSGYLPFALALLSHDIDLNPGELWHITIDY